MAILNKGQTFSDGEQVTSTKLNTAVDGATFASGAVDDVSTQLSGGAIIVKDGGVTTAKIADDAVTTTKIADNNVITSKIADSNVTTAKIANNNVTTSKIANSNITTEKIADSNVTKGKIENVANMKVFGNTSGSSAAPQEVSILDEDDMVSDSNTALATQQSVKAYIDNNSITQTSGTAPYYGVRAFGAFDGSTTPPTIIASGNVTSVTRLATGVFEVTLTNAMPNGINYCVTTNEDHHITVTYETNTTVSRQSSSVFQLSTGGSSGLFNSRYVGFMVMA
jgi:hypothetical protein